MAAVLGCVQTQLRRLPLQTPGANSLANANAQMHGELTNSAHMAVSAGLPCNGNVALHHHTGMHGEHPASLRMY